MSKLEIIDVEGGVYCFDITPQSFKEAVAQIEWRIQETQYQVAEEDYYRSKEKK
jgi:hypothetical protein